MKLLKESPEYGAEELFSVHLGIMLWCKQFKEDYSKQSVPIMKHKESFWAH